MEALVTGLIPANTGNQKRLIQVHNDEVEPISRHERVWWKLIQRRKWEKEVRESPHYEVADKSEQWFSRVDWKKMHERENQFEIKRLAESFHYGRS